MKVLVIEDDAETATYVARGLHEHGHIANHAPDGRDGLRRTATRSGERIELQPREFRLLEFLLRHAGSCVTPEVVTRTMLLEGVWDFYFDRKTNIVETQISRLRGKLSHGGRDPELIYTLRGSGYVRPADRRLHPAHPATGRAASCRTEAGGLGNRARADIMLDSILAPIAAWIVGVISASGYAGVAGLMAIESACIPLPSEIIMPFAGYLASTGRFSLVLAATAGAIGCNIGSTIAYAAGAYGGRGLVERWGHYILLDPGDLDRADRFFQRFGGPAVLVARLLPVVRTFIALPAGIARMPQLPFQLYAFIGSWPWCFALAYVGYLLGEHWETDPRLRTVPHRFDYVIVGLLVLGFAWFVWRHIRRPRQERRKS